jgi:hypothetical protein
MGPQEEENMSLIIPCNDDPWDPNTWGEPLRYKTITLSSDGEVYCIVDEDKYDELMEDGPWTLYEYGGKQYAKRTRRKGERGPVSIYMHRVLAMRYLPRPSPRHIIVDHKRSNGLDNRLHRIRWVTPRDNRLNAYGRQFQSKDFFEELRHGQHQPEDPRHGIVGAVDGTRW